MATDTFELTWNISKQGRGDKKNLKQAIQFEMQSNITYHSKYGPFAHAIQIERRDISTATQTPTLLDRLGRVARTVLSGAATRKARATRFPCPSDPGGSGTAG